MVVMVNSEVMIRLVGAEGANGELEIPLTGGTLEKLHKSDVGCKSDPMRAPRYASVACKRWTRVGAAAALS